jgi:hypothetical protein
VLESIAFPQVPNRVFMVASEPRKAVKYSDCYLQLSWTSLLQLGCVYRQPHPLSMGLNVPAHSFCLQFLIIAVLLTTAQTCHAIHQSVTPMLNTFRSYHFLINLRSSSFLLSDVPFRLLTTGLELIQVASAHVATTIFLIYLYTMPGIPITTSGKYRLPFTWHLCTLACSHVSQSVSSFFVTCVPHIWYQSLQCQWAAFCLCYVITSCICFPGVSIIRIPNRRLAVMCLVHAASVSSH